jgi:EAL domain-containing protein (putative c-di-GMP-specific phosphodiesterase class I)
VETEEQLEILRQNGCQAFQGYLFSKAVPLAEFESQIGRPKMILSNHMDASIGAGI